VDEVSLWVSPERLRGSATFKRCTGCGSRLFKDENESLEFSGTHPRQVLCLPCHQRLESDSSEQEFSLSFRDVARSLRSGDVSIPVSPRILVMASLVLAAFLAVVAVRTAQLPEPPGPFQGIRDLALVYVPSEKGREVVDQGFLAPYVSFLDDDGASKEWLFDSFLFISLTSDSGSSFWGTSHAVDWRWWVEKLFTEGEQIDSLNRQVRAAGEVLGTPEKRGVIVSVPYPDPRVTDFGMTDDRGRPIKFEGKYGTPRNGDRLQACIWFVDSVIERWKLGQYRYLELLGFYWIQEELLSGDRELISDLADYIHGRGMGIYWIPYNSEGNMEDLSGYTSGDLAFDYVWIQPNHAFRDRVSEPWRERRDLDLVARNADRMGVSIEIELDPGTFLNGDMKAINNFYHYLDGGLTHMYMRKPLAYYVFPYQMYSSHNPVVRESYDVLCSFVKDRHEPAYSVIGGNVEDLPASLVKFGPETSWGKVETISGQRSRLGFPGAEISIGGVDISKDHFLAIRYLTYHSGAIEMKTMEGWKEIGTLAGDGMWQVAQWKAPLSGTNIRILDVRLTNFTWISDIWMYPDETVFEIRSLASGADMPGIYAESANVNGSWQVSPADGISLEMIDPRIPWTVVIRYSSEDPVLLDISNSRTLDFFTLRPSPDSTAFAFRTRPHEGGTSISLNFNGSASIQEAYVSPFSFLTNVGTSWDTNRLRHRPGVYLEKGWSAQRTSEDRARSYRSGRPGATLVVDSLGVDQEVTVTLGYRADGIVVIGPGTHSIPPSSSWATHSFRMVPSDPQTRLTLDSGIDLDYISIIYS